MDLIIITLLAIIAAEATYLVAAQTNKSVHKKVGRPVFIDTSVLIDGRIIAVAASGFIGSDTLFIPRSVIGELQFLADNADTEKRSRARHGLDIVAELQSLKNVKVDIFQDGSKAEEGVDERLLKLAKQYNGAVCTIDYNLNKVAQVENIPVLNVNDLAMSLRMAYLPGEKMLLELTQKGNDSHQAIGHLTDGTMVVVERANKLIGKTVEIEFIRSLQTAAGKMMFAKLTNAQAAKPVEPFKNTQPKRSKQIDSRSKNIASVVAPEPTPAPTVFHSDQLQPQSKINNTQPRVQGGRQPQPKSKKPRTSAQNEASLIAMLNNQVN